ncbi:GTP cyclohydrolase II [Cryptococcus amylolentus CBS 6273]|uniref:GTP cyclohydrolase II n=1 Tax=Cryptococcus amylolentus CBS 6273 TaxID=1296118 RepID=A0A1E3JV72_9TREE|nr:GTP cyclohydrolase II [Cryptococcus amylolentus CBS 6273]
MPSLMAHTQAAHSAPTQADLDILSLLTSDQSSFGPLAAPQKPNVSPPLNTNGRKKQLPRRESPIDALMISAVLAGSGPVTRHHFGHGMARTGAYASCDESRPSSPGQQTNQGLTSPKVVMKSTQAPRSERVRMEREAKLALQRKLEAEKITEDVSTSSTAGPSVTGGGPAPVDEEHQYGHAPASSRYQRKMSLDPTSVTQLLSFPKPSFAYNHFHSYPSGSAAFNPIPNSLPGPIQVRCMARTRVPTPHGEIFLHLYHNSHDTKEHLAVVIDPVQLDPETRSKAPEGRKEIRSKSLNAVWREGETEMERIVRGAYVGRLKPGVASSRGDGLPPVEGLQGVEDVKPLVRIHSECFTGETIGSMRCDCGEQLDEAIHQIGLPQRIPQSQNSHTPLSPGTPSHLPGRGVVIYLRQEGRGIGLLEKIRAYNLQDLGHDTVTANLMLGHGADERKYDIAAEMLRDLGLEQEGIRLLTNNPEKVAGLAGEGIRVVERVGMVPRDWQCGDDQLHPNAAAEQGEKEEKDYEDWRMRRAGVGLIGSSKAQGPELEKYLRTKVERMGHIIDIPKDL